MAFKSAKQAKKDTTAKDDAPAAHTEVSMSALTSLLEEHILSTEFKTALTSLEAKLDLVQAAVSDHGSRITSLESEVSLSKAPNPQLLPGRCNMAALCSGCVFT